MIPWTRPAGAAMACLLVLVAIAFLRALLALRAGFFNINDAYFVGQDAIVLTLFFVIWMAAAVAQRGRGAVIADRVVRVARKADRRWAIALALGTAAVVVAGAALIVHGVRLSGDEFFADFDARIFATGRLVAPIPPEWRPYARALQPTFVSITPDGMAWSSVYLPINAAIRAPFARLGSADLAGPCLAAVSIGLVWRLARRLWPERPDAAVVGAGLLALSPQFLLTAMTPFAMTADLAFGLAWLNLFLARGARAQAAAAAIAFLACGVHKWLFDPLFAAPFLVWAWRQGRRRAAVAATAAFAASIAFWTAWPSLESVILNAPTSLAGVAEIGQVARHAGWNVGTQVMAENLIRFAVWQSPATLPLALAGGWLAFRRPVGIIAAFAAGPLIAVGLLAIILPFQGHGWGYRYLHPWLGSLSILAAAAWVRMVPQDDATGGAGGARAVLAAALLGVLIVLPLQVVMARADLAGMAAISDQIARAPTDVVLVDTQSDPFGADFVRNDPFLATRPKVMEADLLSGGQIAALAASHSLGWLTLRGGEACLSTVVFGQQKPRGETCRPVPPGVLASREIAARSSSPGP